MSVVPRQDMPPPGGYGPINYTRTPAKALFNPFALFGFVVAMHVVGFYVHFKVLRQINKDRVEMRSCKLAITPLLLAEEDRNYLRLMRYNRDEEAKLMANVEGWEVGKLYGEPIFKTMKPDEFFEYPFSERYAHSSLKEIINVAEHIQWY